MKPTMAYVVAILYACSPTLPREQLLDPNTCAECHPAHHDEWQGSMHAYASEDPVFLAMNARGQRETNGELGDFCVNCHAPMAVREGLTTDGLNLDAIPDAYQGVTCYFCHNAAGVSDDHNAAIDLANDTTMRGGLEDPVPNSAHRSAWSSLLDRDSIESSNLCGSCHDIVTPAGVELERTFQEWRNTLYSDPVPGRQQTCGTCHLQGRDDVAAEFDGVSLRRVHDHRMPGVDVALTSFPNIDDQREQVQRALDTTVRSTLQVLPLDGSAEILLTLENIAAGHAWPSGAAHDRRAWVEVIASKDDEILLSTGVLDDGTALTDLQDPNLWRLGDRVYGADGEEVHMFWDVHDYDSSLLPGPTAHSPTEPDYTDTHVLRSWSVSETPDHISVRVFIRPMGLDVLQDLVDSGDLDAGFIDLIPTFELQSARLDWNASDSPSP